ncbi:tripartite tricarboxylate transporter TctA [Mycolicibacterium murale]|uniref:Tripartite tricarboxylate transporter TctA n=1 Tax=Mycolicibacterium murale TaxID=182220 RepID=A0A7I9WEE9_9MYCO|nr:tripartite tricarboxylate transporter permease [Mycolicibacterium murale]MCV7182238.1 tripartite tricarboxylate transporter permease [Mycolicibacterium murale]GFG56064.1 tripartite tricarboxylate transporter TctA [Mycolicibacterium murale]
MSSTLTDLFSGFASALTPQALLFAFLGVLVGTIVGVLPGIGPVAAIALLIPLSFGLPPEHGLILLCSIYFGSMYGGSITATLIRTPGEIASVVTSLDGYQMAKNGRAGAALATAAIGSFIAGTLALIGLTLLSPVLASIAVSFGAHEYFLLMLLALILAATLTTGSRVKAWMSVMLGLAVGVIGLDPQTGGQRLTFGLLELQDGIDFAIFAMALFAIPEALNQLASRGRATEKPLEVHGRIWMSREEWRRSAGPWARGSGLGFGIGLLPGVGPSLAAFSSYLLERGISKDKKKFGRGAIEGVAGPEAANNAGVGGSMVPLFSLGIPGSATTALLLFVFMMYGLQPGPQLFETNTTLVWTIIAAMYVGNVMLLLLNLPLVGLFVKLLSIPIPYLFAGVLAFVVLGAYTLSFSVFSMVVLFAFGLVGFFMEKVKIPLAPAVLALVLFPLLERNLRRSMQISNGDLTSFLSRPLSLGILVVAALVLGLPLIGKLLRKRRASSKAPVGVL